jgi:hypothetical protein
LEIYNNAVKVSKSETKELEDQKEIIDLGAKLNIGCGHSFYLCY